MYIKNLINDFIIFLIENKLLSLFIISFFAVAISQLLLSIKTNIIEFYLNKLFKTSNNNLINLI